MPPTGVKLGGCGISRASAATIVNPDESCDWNFLFSARFKLIRRSPFVLKSDPILLQIAGAVQCRARQQAGRWKTNSWILSAGLYSRMVFIGSLAHARGTAGHLLHRNNVRPVGEGDVVRQLLPGGARVDRLRGKRN